MSDIKFELLTLSKKIWDNGFFNHPGVVVDGKSVLTILKAHYETKLAEQKQCPKREKGKNHAWETHSTDSGEETFCTKCFIYKSVIDGKKAVLKELLAELI